MTEQRGLELYELLRASHLFKRLNDQQVEQLAAELPIESIREGNLVFEQASPAKAFYFIINGRVNALLVDQQKENKIGTYKEGDYFGQDAIQPHGFYSMRTQTATDVTVAVLSHDAYIRLIRRYPLLEESFDVMVQSYRLNLRQDFTCDPDRETIHFIARKHVIFLFLRLLIPSGVSLFSILPWVTFFTRLPSTFMLILSAFLTLLGMGLLFWFWLDWSNDYVVITDRRVIYQERVVLMYESQQEAPLEAILSDDILTTFWGRWLGYGSVVVRTFTGTLTLPRLAHPREVKMILAERRTRATSQGRRTRRDMMTDVIRRRLGGDPNAQIPREEKPLPVKVKSGALQTTLNDLLNTRWEKGDAIIYRTHWLMLITRIAVPSAVALFVTALIIWGAIQQNFLASPLFLGLLFLVLVADIVFWTYRYVDWSNDQYIITRMEVVDVYKKPLGKEERRSAPLESIQSINHERKNFIALVFNYGTVFIRVGDDSLSFDNVPDPANVQREIFDRFWERKQAKEKRSTEDEQERMVEWLEAYDDVHRRMV